MQGWWGGSGDAPEPEQGQRGTSDAPERHKHELGLSAQGPSLQGADSMSGRVSARVTEVRAALGGAGAPAGPLSQEETRIHWAEDLEAVAVQAARARASGHGPGRRGERVVPERGGRD